MELRDSLTLYRRRWVLVVVLLAAVVGGAFGWSYSRPQYYTTSMSFAVNGTDVIQTDEYQYGGYYALQAADLFSQTVVSWLQTPSVLVNIYDRAGISTDVESFASLTSRFKTKKYSAQNIVVTYTTETEAEGQQIATALADELSSRTANLNQVGSDASQFEVIAADPVIVLTNPDPLLIGIVSFAVALILIVFLVPLTEYFSAGRRTA